MILTILALASMTTAMCPNILGLWTSAPFKGTTLLSNGDVRFNSFAPLTLMVTAQDGCTFQATNTWTTSDGVYSGSESIMGIFHEGGSTITMVEQETGMEGDGHGTITAILDEDGVMHYHYTGSDSTGALVVFDTDFARGNTGPLEVVSVCENIQGLWTSAPFKGTTLQSNGDVRFNSFAPLTLMVTAQDGCTFQATNTWTTSDGVYSGSESIMGIFHEGGSTITMVEQETGMEGDGHGTITAILDEDGVMHYHYTGSDSTGALVLFDADFIKSESDCGGFCAPDGFVSCVQGLCVSTCPSSATCCEPTGCENQGVRNCVGIFDPFCKDEWDAQCVAEAQVGCGLSC